MAESPDTDVTRLPDEAGASPPPPPALQPTLAPGQMFGKRYRIAQLLGSGGMGEVYLAWDADLGVHVALKVIRQQSTAAGAGQLEYRFKRELVLAREITHRNVIRIHDLGDVDGVKYISMSYIEGSNLSSVLRQSGPLPVRKALRIARDIAAGLQAVHAAGVVHCDLKPANVMIRRGHAIIMDFGIARALSGTDGRVAPDDMPNTAARSTEPSAIGSLMGTPEYMAPEQAVGAPIDHRADIYAFGLTLYDMLISGRVREADRVDELRDRLLRPPTPIRELNPKIPGLLDHVIRHCLEPDPAHRYQTIGEVTAALHRLDPEGRPRPAYRRFSTRQLAAAAVVMAILLIGTWWLSRPAVPPPVRDPVSVLIADFDSTPNERAVASAVQQALAVGIEGASFITTYPARDAWRIALQLMPGTERMTEEIATLIAIREGIKIVLAGAIDGPDAGHRITVRVVDPAVRRVLATTSVSPGPRTDVLRGVGTLAARVRSVLGDTEPESARRAAAETFTTMSLEAVSAYSTAQDLATSGRWAESIEEYKRAIQYDPTFGRAYAGWATSAFRVGREEEAHDLYKKAFALMDRMTDREKYRTLGGYFVGLARDYPKAIENFEELIKLYPADGVGHNNLALAYFSMLRLPEALEEGRRVRDIYPRVLLYRSNYALYAMYAGDFATASSEASIVVRENPAYATAYLPIAIAALEAGDSDAARDAYAAMARASAPGRSRANLGLADLDLYRGRPADAAATLHRGIAEDERAGNKGGLAMKYAVLGETRAVEGNPTAAAAAAMRALALGPNEGVRFTAGRVLAGTGMIDRAKSVALELSDRVQPQSRAYGRILAGEIAIRERRFADAVNLLRSAREYADTWMGRLHLGIALLGADQGPQALSELELCLKRRGEASAVLLDDLPSYRYRAVHLYWLARAQQEVGLGSVANDTYDRFLALRPAPSSDPLARDAERRRARGITGS